MILFFYCLVDRDIIVNKSPLQQVSAMHIFLPRVMNEQFSIIIISFFQFFGTMLFGYINLSIINAKATAPPNQDSLLLFISDFAFSLFICASYGRQFSGGVYNSAIILYRQLRKTDRLTLKVGMTYQIAQYLGGSVGCLIAVYMNDLTHVPITKLLDSTQQIRQFFTEAIGTFILTFMGQMLIEKKMTFIEHNREFYIAIPLIFMTSRGFSQSSNGLNPALGFAFQFAYAYKTGNWEVFSMIYILIIGPYVGAIFAVIFFQYVLKPLYPFKKNQIQQIIQQILAQNQKKMRENPQVTQQQILKYKQKYCQQALKLGIQLQSLVPPVPSLFPTKVINHRWSLSQTLTQQPMYAPINYQPFQAQNNLSIIGQQYLDEDIESIESDQQQVSFISHFSRRKQKALNHSFNNNPGLNTSFNVNNNSKALNKSMTIHKTINLNMTLNNMNNSFSLANTKNKKVEMNKQWQKAILDNFYQQFSMREQSSSKQQSHNSSFIHSSDGRSKHSGGGSGLQKQSIIQSSDNYNSQGEPSQQNEYGDITYEDIRRKYQEQQFQENHLESQQQQSQQQNKHKQESISMKMMKRQKHDNDDDDE